MGSYATVQKITLPLPTVLSVPSGYINENMVGFRPKSVVVYTHSGEYLAELHEGDGGAGYQFRNPEVADLLTALSIEAGDYLELVSHSNTDLFVRAYYPWGSEKNCGKSSLTHYPRHMVVELTTDSHSSLTLASNFNRESSFKAPERYAMRTDLETRFVNGTGLGPNGSAGIKFSGPDWEQFFREKMFRPGMKLVFQLRHRDAHDFSVFCYNRDGSLNLFSSGKPTGFDHGTSFYRLMDENAFQGPNQLKVPSRFASWNDYWLRRTVLLRTAGGDFSVESEQEWIVGGQDGRNYHRRLITGDWPTLSLANGFRTPPRLKFQKGHNKITCAPPTDCMYAVEFIPTPGGGGVWQAYEEGSAESSG